MPMQSGLITTHQRYALYTSEDQEVWSILFTRQMAALKNGAYRHFAGGLKRLRFLAGSIPEFKMTNLLLEPGSSSWRIQKAFFLRFGQFK
ncbi:MAG TPA: hypothetical protein VFC34_09655 [Puia sp.]|nr:hypothetical protein [Puia sp.]